jgi:toxin-antitoxin system PIN domain toxin
VILCDVNILVFALRADSERHDEYADWLNARTVDSDEAFAVSDHVLSSVLRIVTNRRAFERPSTLDMALGFVEELRDLPNAVLVQPGPRHWGIFTGLCRKTNATGNLVPDAYFAALAIEHGCEWVTADRGFARFPGLRWRHPLDG